LTNWYIRGMARAQMEMWDDADPSWGSSKSGRRRFGSPVRGPTGQFCPYGGDPPKNTDLPIKSGVPGQECPVSTDKIDRCQRTAVSGDTGQNCPGAPDKIDRCQGTAVSVDTGQPCPGSPDKIDRSHRTAVADFKESQTVKRSPEGSTFKRSTLVNAQKKVGGNE